MEGWLTEGDCKEYAGWDPSNETVKSRSNEFDGRARIGCGPLGCLTLEVPRTVVGGGSQYFGPSSAPLGPSPPQRPSDVRRRRVRGAEQLYKPSSVPPLCGGSFEVPDPRRGARGGP